MVKVNKFNPDDIMDRQQIALQILQSSVAAIDALGFEAKVYQDEESGKRLADMFTHPGHEYNVSEAAVWIANLGNQCQTFLDMVGWVETGNG